MYLPITVSPRYTDILRGFISLYQLWKNNKTIKNLCFQKNLQDKQLFSVLHHHNTHLAKFHLKSHGDFRFHYHHSNHCRTQLKIKQQLLQQVFSLKHQYVQNEPPNQNINHQ